jgi:hypothetical protein
MKTKKSLKQEFLNEEFLPLSILMTEIRQVNRVEAGIRKNISSLKYNSDRFPVFRHFKSILRF